MSTTFSGINQTSGDKRWSKDGAAVAPASPRPFSSARPALESPRPSAARPAAGATAPSSTSN
ncbi:hypothetical protein [Chromobacterium violaceum]|uniref:hypothetical protein n=1 Tax=Chromobacterium violaceum TaxID=536 RepID=UPI0011C031FE|nr:hypothetical protein [Chromobacterium violaceum]